MCAYNRLNGEFGSENKYLLNDILREEWGYDGLVVTDWGAANDRVKGLIAGQDLEMPSSGTVNDSKVEAAVKDGSLPVEYVDRAVRRLLELRENSMQQERQSRFPMRKIIGLPRRLPRNASFY